MIGLDRFQYRRKIEYYHVMQLTSKVQTPITFLFENKKSSVYT